MDYNQDPNIIIDRLIEHVKSSQKVADIASAMVLKPVSASYVKERIAKRKQWAQVVKKLESIPQIEQRSEEWYQMRWDLITASDLAQSLGCGKFGTQRDFYIKKCDVETSRASLPDCPPLVWGIKYEPVAAAIYERFHNTKLIEFGLLPHPDYPFIGASPDGITTDGIMVEIKCPYARKPKPEVPTQYYYQIQSQLDVCNLDECDYFECRFREYAKESDFLADKHSDHPKRMLSAGGFDKGIIVELKNGKYEYCPHTELDAALDWTKHTKNSAAKKVTYWYLESVNLIRVYRDVDFIHHQYDKARKVWDNVLKYRSDSHLFKKEVILNNQNCSVDSMEECAIDTDSDC